MASILISQYHAIAIQRTARKGYIHVLAWLKSRGLLDVKNIIAVGIKSAITGGHIHILKWLGKNTVDLIADEAVTTAIQFGRIEILELFCQWQYNVTKPGLETLFKYGHYLLVSDPYPLVCWLKEHNHQFSLQPILRYALTNDDWHIVQWILTNTNGNARILNYSEGTKLSHYQAFRKQYD